MRDHEPAQENEGYGADQGRKHVFLRVPDIALGGEEANRSITAKLRGPPFDEFV